MNVGTLKGVAAAGLLLCSNASHGGGMEAVQAPGMEIAQPPRGMEVVKAPGMEIVQPPRGMEAVKAPGMQVAPPPSRMEVVKAPGMEIAQPPKGMAVVKPQGMRRYTPGSDAAERGRAIDPQGQGLNQAQINAMEAQRQMMWNATGGGMVYR